MNDFKEKAARAIFTAAAFMSIAAVILICIFLFANGIPAASEIGYGEFIFGTKWKPASGRYGIFPMIVGSIYVTAGAIITGVPLGILTAVYLAEYCGERTYRVLKPAIDLLAGIPSVVYGFFGLMVIVPAVHKLCGVSGKGVLAASLLLGIMILPTIIGVAEAAVRGVPRSYYEGSLALGATRERSIFRVTLPAASSGVLAGVVLGIGRAVGETMAVIMVAGNQAVIPRSVFDGVRTMTSNIVLEMGYASDLHREALIATAAVLLVFILIINLSFSCLKRSRQS